MAAGDALLRQRWCGVAGVVEVGSWKKERGAEGRVKLGLSRGGSLHSRCRRRQAGEVLVRASGKTNAVTEEMQAECSGAESQNGGYVLPELPSISNSPGNEHIGYGVLDESNFYRERFVVRFSEVGDRKTMSLELLASLLQVFFLTREWLTKLQCLNKRSDFSVFRLYK